jgi:PAS domain S-box-containing protein
LFEAAADAILLVSRRGVIENANPATLDLVESTLEGLVGRSLESFLAEEDLERARAYLVDSFEGRPTTEPFEVSILLPSGRRKSLSVRSRPVRESGTTPYIEMLVRDVTEQREMQRRLVASERLASVGQMAAYVAHEINTPLANVSLLAAAAKRKTKDPDIRERLEKIDDQRRHAAAIIADLLSFTRHREIQTVEVDLRNVISDSIGQIEPYRRKEVSLIQDLGERPTVSAVDPLQMQEVFVNILRNAFEATERGSVTVCLENRSGCRIVTVTDTGSGIPLDIQVRLFQPFVTTKRQTGGTGLGLALCKNIVTAHGGEIHFTSELGKGTTFTIVLPQGEGA